MKKLNDLSYYYADYYNISSVTIQIVNSIVNCTKPSTKDPDSQNPSRTKIEAPVCVCWG